MLGIGGRERLQVASWAVDGGKQQPEQEREARVDTGRCCLETQLTGGFAGS